MNKRDVAAAFFFAIVAVFLIFGAFMMHPFGEIEESDMDDYIIRNTQSIDADTDGAGADNAVTAVVFDYRGFDTLGEATVLFTAVAGVIMIFRRLKDD